MVLKLRAKWPIVMLIALPFLLACTLILWRPEQISQRLLRTGGRAVQFLAEEWRGVGVVGAVAIVLLWAVIAVTVMREKSD